MANYQYVNVSLAPANGDCTTPQPIGGAGAGSRIVSWTLVALPSGYLDSGGLSRVSICIGGSTAPAVRLKEGMSWSAPLDDDGRPIPETGGLFLVGDSNMLSIKGFEFYVEMQPGKN